MMNDRQTSRLFWAAKAGLAVILVYVATTTILGPLGLGRPVPESAVGSEPIPAPLTTATAQKDRTDYSAILENDLFAGGNEPETVQVSPPVEPLRSADDLGLTLVGVIAFSSNPAKSCAVIASEQSASGQPYSIGDVVASATIEAIETNRVILRYAGQRCILEQRTGTGSPERSAPSQTAAGRSATSSLAGASSGRLGYVEDVFRNATIEQHVQDDRVDGLRISGLEQSPLAASIGLRNGDIIRSVNGQSLTSKQKAFQVLQKARTQPALDIEIVRDGRTKNLSFDL
jgi:general secretion pathway protein C